MIDDDILAELRAIRRLLENAYPDAAMRVREEDRQEEWRRERDRRFDAAVSALMDKPVDVP